MIGAMICPSDPSLPDAGEGSCCIGAAMRGPAFCTCWEPVYDRRQRKAKEGPANVRVSMCVDCAYRPQSPERSGDQRYACSDAGELEDLAASETAVFMCHQGMRRLVARVHPSGVRVEIPIDAYKPPERSNVKANGQPAEVCAGFWLARQRARAK